MDFAEAERVEAGNRFLKAYSLDIARMRRVLSTEGVTSTDVELARIWHEFSMMWTAEWIPLPQSNNDLLHILLRGLRKRSISELDWQLKCLDRCSVLEGRPAVLPVRWDVTPTEFDAAATRILQRPIGNLSRRKVCEIIAQQEFVAGIKQYPGLIDDLGKIRFVASAYWHPANRQGPDDYPR